MSKIIYKVKETWACNNIYANQVVVTVVCTLTHSFCADHNSLENDTQSLSALTATLPKLQSLQVLDLSFNRLTFCPPAIAKLTTLTCLNLSRNRLESLSDQPHTRSLARLVRLQVHVTPLIQASSHQSQLPYALLCNDKVLNLSGNALKCIHPGVLRSMTSLADLDLESNRMLQLGGLFAPAHAQSLKRWASDLHGSAVVVSNSKSSSCSAGSAPSPLTTSAQLHP